MARKCVVALLTLVALGCATAPTDEAAEPDGSSVSEDGLVRVARPSRGVLFVVPLVGERLYAYRKAQLGDFSVVHKDKHTSAKLVGLDERMRAYLREAVKRDFAERNGYPVVTGPGRDVFVIDAVLRDVQITPPPGGPSTTATVFQSTDSMTYGLQLSDSLTGEPLLRYFAKKHLPGGRYFGAGTEPDWMGIRGAIDAFLDISHEEIVGLLASVQEAQGYPWPPAATVTGIDATDDTGPLGREASTVVRVGHLADHSGRTGSIGGVYAQGIADAVVHINRHGGVNGTPIQLSAVDFQYDMPRALAAYRQWQREDVVAILGWGIASTELLAQATGEDRIPLFPSAPHSPFMDPMGRGPVSPQPSPYVFPMGSSYSDQGRALIRWATGDWSQKPEAASRRPLFVYMGANHPWTNLFREVLESYAAEQGFQVGDAIEYPLYAGDFKSNCRRLEEQTPDYVFLGNTAGANVSLLRSCASMGVKTQFLTHMSGFNEHVMKYAGRSSDDVIWAGRVRQWGTTAAGSETLRSISSVSDPDARYRPLVYTRAVCNMFVLKEAMEWAHANGGITGPNIKRGMYQRVDWVPLGMEEVCPAGTWTPEDHRGFMSVIVYRSMVAADGAVDAKIEDLVAEGAIAMEQLATIKLPRKPEWLGW